MGFIKTMVMTSMAILAMVIMTAVFPTPFFDAVQITFAQFEAQISSTAVTDEHGKRKGNDGDGEDDVCRTVAQISDTPANKNLVDDVVECVYHQRNDTGDGEFDDQPTHRFGCKRTFVLIRSVFHL